MSRTNSGALSTLLLLALLGSVSEASSAAQKIELDWQSPSFAEHPLVGSIHINQSVVSTEQLIQQMVHADHILIGEKHDNADHQQLEVYLLEALNHAVDSNGNTLGVVLEMLDSSQQGNIDLIEELLAANEDHELSEEQMKADLDWPVQGWVWDDYAPVISWVLDNGVPLYAGNIDNTQMQSVYRNGIDAEFSSARALREDLQQPVLEQVYQGHCELMEKDNLSPMVDVQLVKDAAMANALIDIDTDMSVLIAGTGHTRIDSAIPKHLELLSDGQVLSVALVEVDPALSSIADYDVADRFNVLIFTPVSEQHDYCAELEKSMGKY